MHLCYNFLTVDLNDQIHDRVRNYLAYAHRAIRTGRLALTDEDFSATVNRAYYAMFYSANALLATRGLERSKHTGVISTFREQYVKTGLIKTSYSRYFGEALDERHTADYELEPIDFDTAGRNLAHAVEFVAEIESYLRREGVIS